MAEPEATGSLPRGVVTFLFTDVAGSTRLWEDAPAAMGPAMARHDELVEAEVARHGGIVVRPRGEGDSRFAVFARASSAAAAAVAVQRALGRERWATPRPVAVRLALHTGEADVRAGDYYGRAVNRCARLRALGSPGQVLLSRATADLVADALPGGTRLVTLGSHLLPDLVRPEQVFELTDGTHAFPPLRSTPLALQFRVLGPLEVADGPLLLPLGGPRQRAVLAALVLRAGAVVPASDLLAAGWGERLPDAAPAALRGAVGRLRRLLGPRAPLLARAPGYLLDVPPESVDVLRAEVRAAEARTELAEGRFETAARALADTLALWRGQPLDGTPAPAAELERLERLRLGLLEDLLEAELACSRPEAVVGPARAALARQPARPRLWRQLALALHRSGDTAGALATCRDARAAVPADAGLLELEGRLGAGDPGLGGPPGAARRRLQVPVPAQVLVGREDEVERVLLRLREPGTRWLTLLGPGGAGKSRLALEVAARALGGHPGGSFFVPLAGVTDVERVLPAVAGVLGLAAPADTLPAALAVSLGGAPTLLVLDNLEQLRGAGPALADLLAAAPSLTVLATSRSPVRLRVEREHPLPPLDLPVSTAPDDVERSASGRLFLERARAVRPELGLDEAAAADIAEICRRLDGLPLALELAAARMSLLSPGELLARLDSQLAVLTGGAEDLPDRQRTLRATLDWSHALLPAPAQRLLARLGAFVGEFDLGAAEQLGADGPDLGTAREVDVLGDLAALVSSSLARRREVGGRTRFRLLEPVREYAVEQLAASGTEPAVRRRLLRLLADRVEAALPSLDRPLAAEVLAGLREQDRQFEAALTWAVDDEPALAGRLAVALRVYWLLEGRLTQGRAWLDAVLRSPLAPDLQPRALAGAGVLAYVQDDHERAGARLTAALAAADRVGDEATAATATGYLGALALGRGDRSAAAASARSTLSVAVRLGLYEEHSLALSLAAVVAALEGDLAAERALHGERLELARRHGDGRRTAETLNNLAEVALLEQDVLTARSCAEEALDLARGVSRVVTRDALLTLGRVELSCADRDRAAVHLAQAVRLSVDLGQEFELAQGLLASGALATEAGEHPTAARLYGAGARLRGARSPVDLDLEPDVAQRWARSLEALGEASFAAAGRDGAALALEAAVALAARTLGARGSADLVPRVGEGLDDHDEIAARGRGLVDAPAP